MGDLWPYPLDVAAVLAVFGRPAILGVSGRAEGVLDVQRDAAADLLDVLPLTALHHGDCLGWDVLLAGMADERRIDTWAHPPDNPHMRAFHDSTVLLPEKPYMVRNTDIANDTRALLAAPPTDEEIVRSGTWATVRRARAAGRPVLLLCPGGARVEMPAQPALTDTDQEGPG